MKNNKIKIIVFGVLVIALFFLLINIKLVDEVFLDSGKIDMINGTIIAIEITTSGADSIPGGWQRMLRVETDRHTKFIGLNDIPISLENLNEGDSIGVYKDDNVIVKKGELFTATRIVLLDPENIQLN